MYCNECSGDISLCENYTCTALKLSLGHRERKWVGVSPVVRPALSAELSSCTLHTNVHISTAVLFFSCTPYVYNKRSHTVTRPD